MDGRQHLCLGALAGLTGTGYLALRDRDDCLADKISANELKAIQLQWAELVGSGQQLMLALEAKHEATMAKWVARQGGAA